MAVKVEIKNVKAVQAQALKALNKVKQDQKFLVEQSKFTAEQIQRRTWSGRGVDGKKFKKLSQSYLDYRNGKVSFRKIDGRVVPLGGKDPKFPNTGEFFKANFSNLTLTGQLLRSISRKINVQKGSFRLFFSGVRKDGMKNEELAKIVQDKGRVFFGLGEIIPKRLRKRTLDQLRRVLRQEGF